MLDREMKTQHVGNFVISVVVFLSPNYPVFFVNLYHKKLHILEKIEKHAVRLCVYNPENCKTLRFMLKSVRMLQDIYKIHNNSPVISTLFLSHLETPR